MGGHDFADPCEEKFINIAKGIQVYKLIHDYRLYEFEK